MPSVIEIAPLTRVEGHGGVKVYLDGIRVERVELCLTESPRLFEALLVGKGFAEVPEIVCRICSLCSTIHKVTALVAVERALGIEVSRGTRLTRELIVAGGTIQSHALHLYCLFLPDLMDVPGVPGLAQEAPELLKAGLNVKRVGNLIQESVGGRLIHPVNVKLGGVGRRVPDDALKAMRDEVASIVADCRGAVPLFGAEPQLPPLPSPAYLAVDPASPPLDAERLLFPGEAPIPVADYRLSIGETVLPYSHAKKALVAGREPTVGALSRLNLGQPVPERAPELFDSVRDRVLGGDVRGNSAAQALELAQAADRALELIGTLLEERDLDFSAVLPRPRAGVGVAACEAPRGLLLHGYGFDAEGICNRADVITPTSLNHGALERDLLALARRMEGAEPALLTRALERLVRCYDPCISCSVHLVQL